MGLGRGYEMQILALIRVSSQVLATAPTNTEWVQNTAPNCNSNLKLSRPDRGERLLEARNNSTDASIFGAPHVAGNLDRGAASQSDEVAANWLATLDGGSEDPAKARRPRADFLSGAWMKYWSPSC